MITAILCRTETGDTGTFGTLSIGGEEFTTGELPDRGNAADISSIPAGVYTCHKTFSPHFQADMYHVMDVPGRDGILIHIANFMGDKSKGLKCELNGCIALGLAQGELEGQRAVVSSSTAFDRFNAIVAGQDFTLQITDEYLEAGQPEQNTTA